VSVSKIVTQTEYNQACYSNFSVILTYRDWIYVIYYIQKYEQFSVGVTTLYG